MAEVELEVWDWIAKITEKLTFIRLRANEGVDITDEDYDILKMMFRLHWQGVHPLYLSKLDIQDEITVQQGLFSVDMTNNTSGTGIVYTQEQTKTENKKKVD